MAVYKLLLLQPPVQDFYNTAIRLQPIGLCYLKATVQKFLPEFQVVVKDYHQGWGRHTLPLPKELAYLKDYYAYPDKSPFSSFYQYYHFGASFEAIAEDVAAEQPDLIGISSLFSPYFREVMRCAEAIKQRWNAPIILGGAHVSVEPERMLRHECIDFVIRGEGERPLVEFLRAWMQQSDYDKVPNLGFKRHAKLILNPLAPNYAIDDLPVPDFSDFPANRYLFEQRPLSFVITSRGCPHRCAFCSVHLTFGYRYRRRSNEAILHELQQRYHAGYRVFDFEDDNLTFDRQAMLELCEKIIANFPPGDLQFLAMNGLSYHSLDVELLHKMKLAGFTHLNLSLVSANQSIRNQTRRPHSLEHYFTVVHEAAQLGFQIVSYQILGLPDESLDSMIATLVLNAQLPVLLGASIFYLTPGSPLAQEFPPLTETDVFKARLTAMSIETPHIKRDDLFTLFVTTRILNFFKGLELPEKSMPLAEVLHDAEQQGGRTTLGVTILHKLFEQHSLYATVGNNLKPVRRFQVELFFRVWNQLERICTQQGRQITHLASFSGDFPNG
ncbi:Fe-S oxidoreductase [Candidatus Vecturithrix granuli]|uniref:Fe-S oxidoreductase n=1 Tax=Vecturithrix granuli TaxID=1499967 RepID=A0A081C292_VECG1|nr:Fe-S oxidoreductase [Candidatus Vecturithrix granuli]